MSLTIVPNTPHRPDDYTLEPEIVAAVQNAELRHFWYLSRNLWILEALSYHGVVPPASILEVGCGSGCVASALVDFGYALTGVDTAEPLVRKASERCPNGRFVVAEVANLPSQLRGPYAVVALFDVLEHLDDAAGLLRESVRWAAPNALVIATVPGLRSLWSEHDEISGHKRRYEPGELARLFAQVGLRSIIEHGIFRSTSIAQRFVRRGMRRDVERQRTRDDEIDVMRQSLRIPFEPINTALKQLCALERRFGFAVSAGKAGASQLVVGRVPDPNSVSKI